MSVAVESYGYNPPAHETSKDGDDADSSPNRRAGQRLLALTRLLEKDPDNQEAYMEEIVTLLNSLIALYSRRGLLHGDVARAEKLLSSSQGSINQTKKNKKKGSRNNKALSFHPSDGDGGGEAGDSVGVQSESLVFTALTRILGSSDETNSVDSDSALLVALAAEVCFAISHHVNTSTTSGDSCALAEYELIAHIGKPILTGLVSRMRWVENDIRTFSATTAGTTPGLLKNCLTMASLDEDRHITPLISCLKAACSFVGLFRTKLSRSTALIRDLKAVAWKFVTAPDERLQEAAARLIACLPLAGSTDRKTPADLWNVGVSDMVEMLSMIQTAVAPLGKPLISHEADVPISADSNKILQSWLSFLRQDISESSSRVESFRLFLCGLARCFCHFVLADNMGQNLFEAKLDVGHILQLIETFLSFPLSAEALFFRTKKRLRDEVLDDGLIGSRAIATRVANDVKLVGHEMLDCLLSAMGGSALLPYGRRIIRMSYASLLTSCSGAVRRVMDPTSAAQLEGKNRRWLHLSIPLRAVAVRTVHSMVVAFGSDRTAKINGSERSMQSRSDGEMAISLVAGCLMEQVGSVSNQSSDDDCWGTFEERISLSNSCLDCLRGVVATSGGYIGLSTRSLIDSTILTCLTQQRDSSLGCIFGWSSVKSKVFQLASVCVTTPWNDGAATSIVDPLKCAAIQAVQEMDESVSLAAKEAIRVCDQFGTSRAPPLVIVRRSTTEPGQSAMVPIETSASQIMEDIQKAQTQAAKAREATEEAERMKVQEKRRREAEREESNKRKREERKKQADLKPPPPAALTTEKKEAPKVTQNEDDDGGAVDISAENDTSMEVDKPEEEEIRKVQSVESTLPGKHKSNEGEEDPKMSEKEDAEGFDDDDEFPNIVTGGPDSDDE